MRLRTARTILVFPVILTLVLPPAPASACSISVDAVFTFRNRPDFPIREFVQGKLGIPQPGYPRRYLVIAYRNLSAAPLNAAEQKALLAELEQPSGSSGPNDEITEWIEQRNKILGKPSTGATQLWWGGEFGISRWVQKGTTSFSYFNCLPDAFRNAVKRLQQHTRQFGAGSGEVREWVTAQDQVFANCQGGFGPETRPPTIPGELPPTAPAALRADRRYQIAAAHFYAGQFDEAREGFDAIAQDPASPWQSIAPYLAARVMLREGTLNGGDAGMDEKALLGAEGLLRKVIEDPSRSQWHKSALGLIAYIELRLHPRERLHQLSATLAKPGAAKIPENLTDYTYLLDHFEGNWAGVREGDDLTDWIVTMQNAGPEEMTHALAQWRRSSSPAWLVAALTAMRAPNPELEPLLAAAAKIPPDSPAFAAAAFHRLRLQAEAGQAEQARAGIDALLAQQKEKLPLSALNLLLALRMKLARNLEEFLAFAARTPAGVEYDQGTGGAEPWPSSYIARNLPAGELRFDLDAAQVLNRRLPLRLLARAAQSRLLPASLRRDVAVAAWVRAVLLGKREDGDQMAELVAQLAPEMNQELEAYRGASGPEEALFAGSFAMLRFPGAQFEVEEGIGRATPLRELNSGRDNWWCQMTARQGANREAFERIGDRSPMNWIYSGGNVTAPAFLSEAEKSEAGREWQRLSAVPAVPNHLGGIVLEWARKHPNDPRVPEALHLVVRASRYCFTDKDTGKFSRAAFEMLHRRYPQNEWTKKTPYWFN